MVDILPNNSPALSATSDMPNSVPVETVPVVTPATIPDPAAVPVSTVGAPAGVTTTAVPVDPTPQKEPFGVRISELTKQRREADERAARLEDLFNKQSDTLSRAIEALSKASTVPSVGPNSDTFSSRPDRSQYSDAETYESALVSWSAEQASARAVAEMERKQQEIEEQKVAKANEDRIAQEEELLRTRDREAQEALRTSWEEKHSRAIEKYSDFDEVALSGALPISDPMALVIMNSDDGDEIAYYLGKHPEEAAKIASMIIPGQVFPAGTPRAGSPMPDAIKQAVAMGRLAAKLGLDITIPATPVAPVTNSLAAPAEVPAAAPVAVSTPHAIVMAPAPPNPISGANANATQRTLQDVGSEGTMEEYARMRMPQLQAERRPGRNMN